MKYLKASVILATETAKKSTLPIIMAALNEVEERNESHRSMWQVQVKLTSRQDKEREVESWRYISKRAYQKHHPLDFVLLHARTK